MADGLAKKGTHMPFIGPLPVVPVGQRVIKGWIEKYFRNEWGKIWKRRED